ncbi:MAG TPA: DUF2804 family protein, partial [Acidimicrobiales bacterium]|nr:DUF2804 family protein [Acidimicrobiales bacterium]
TEWRWASASGNGVALNLTEGFTAPTENVVWNGGRLESVGPVRFAFDRENPASPWRITGPDGGVDLAFAPEGHRQESRNLVLAASHYLQPFGTFRGRIGGVVIDGLVGVTEDHVARW